METWKERSFEDFQELFKSYYVVWKLLFILGYV